MNPLQTELVSMAAFLAAFLVILGLYVAVFSNIMNSQRRAIARLRHLSSDKPEEETTTLAAWLRGVLPRIGTILLPKQEDYWVAELKSNLLRAGLYTRNALRVFMGVKLVLMLLLPIPFALVPYGLGLLSLHHALLISLVASCLGMVLPTMWLRYKVKNRQRRLRRAIPDILDMLVLCLESGVSLMSGIQRVTGELQTVHPALAGEMNIIYREIQMGLAVGEGLRSFGERCDLEEVRELASVVVQSERIGASVAKALRTYAESSRLERQQRAEEMAQKAAVKILFPTLLCIFPAVFIVLLGPAAIQISNLFAK